MPRHISDTAAVNALIGANLRALRKRAGHTQMELAAMVGVTYQQIQKYENGQSRMAADLLHQLHRLLEAPLALFFNGAEGSLTPLDAEAVEAARLIAAMPPGPLKGKALDIIRVLAN